MVLLKMRQLCIHELTNVNRTNDVEKFWDLERFGQDCPLEGTSVENRFGVVCSEKLMDRLLIDKKRVAKCVADSREKKLKAERENTAWSDNALHINGWRYRGTLDAELVTQAICAGFVKKPDICQIRDRDREDNATGIVFVIVMLIIGFVIIATMLFYKRSLTKLRTTFCEGVMLVRSQMDSRACTLSQSAQVDVGER